MERNVLEFVDHLHEHFLYPCSINKRGRYNLPNNSTEGYRLVYSLFPVFKTSTNFRLIVSRCTRIASPVLSGRTVHTGPTSMKLQKQKVSLVIDPDVIGLLSLYLYCIIKSLQTHFCVFT
jgi:hypothetical protein